MIQAPPRTILEVFESLPQGTLAQLINNNIVMSPAPDFDHQDTVYELAGLLRAYVKEKSLGKVVGAPIDVYLNQTNVYQPDVLFLAKERMHLVQQGRVKGAPDLIIEVLSPGTENYDKRTKKKVYEQASVKEYWIVDPKTKMTIGYALLGDKYVSLPSETGVISSPLLGTIIHF